MQEYLQSQLIHPVTVGHGPGRKEARKHGRNRNGQNKNREVVRKRKRKPRHGPRYGGDRQPYLPVEIGR